MVMKMNRESISVIVPVYNVEEYLEQCLDSLCKQIEVFDEVILVNDGSTDASQRICKKYCYLNKNFILINQRNQGLSSARNNGLKIAKSNYILFVDSDDYVCLDMAHIIKNKLVTEKLDVLYYSANIIVENNKKIV